MRQPASKSIRWLYSLQGRGIKFGLRNIRTLLREVGNPHELFPSIHVAGTNGKGSTASFLASVFQESGARTALYTSPHLIRFTERIRINGKEIPEKRLEAYVERLRPAIERVGATFFEATTCVAFLYFAEEKVDVAIVETGLGGRLDATNVLHPMASVITNIGLDHMEYLGPTLPRIAAEKGGIIKSGVPVIIGPAAPPVQKILLQIARKKQARAVLASERIDLDCGPQGKVSYAGSHFSTGLLKVGLEGAFQTFNAGLAVATLDVLRDSARFRKLFPRITSARLVRGLARVRHNTRLSGRMITAGPGRRVLLDVAHNQDGVHAAVSSMVGEGTTGLTVVFGVMKEKAYVPMLKQLEWVADEIITVQPDNPRAARASLLCRAARHQGLSAVDGGTVREGLRIALRRRRPVLVIGSHYVVGEALVALGKKTA